MVYNINNIKSLLIVYLAVINLITFFVFFIDKKRARDKRWRISESTLLALSLAGGSLGAIFAMNFFRHKTGNKKFTILVPLFLLANIYLLYYLQSLTK